MFKSTCHFKGILGRYNNKSSICSQNCNNDKPRKIIDYQIVKGNHSIYWSSKHSQIDPNFVAEINTYIKQGYQPFKNLVSIHSIQGETDHVIQIMVKYEE